MISAAAPLYASAAPKTAQYAATSHSGRAWRVKSQRRNATTHSAITVLMVPREKVRNELFPVQSASRTLSTATFGQFI